MATLDLLKERLTDLKFHQSVMALRQARKSLADVYPAMELRFNRHKRQTLVRELAACATVEACIGFTRRHMGAGSCQVPWEIESALQCIAEARPRMLCEIGTFDGGTSLLFARFLPTLERMLCIDLYVKNKEFLKLLAGPRLAMQFLDMPSYAPVTVDKASRMLGTRPIDVLFIDGDHRYEGVKEDFLRYRPMVREGGLILFHDIMDSDGSGPAWAGGVPRLWRELSAIYPHREFVHRPDQQGFGIGVLSYRRETALPAGFAG